MLVVNGKYVAAAGSQISKIVCCYERVTRNYPRVCSGKKKKVEAGWSETSANGGREGEKRYLGAEGVKKLIDFPKYPIINLSRLTCKNAVIPFTYTFSRVFLYEMNRVRTISSPSTKPPHALQPLATTLQATFILFSTYLNPLGHQHHSSDNPFKGAY